MCDHSYDLDVCTLCELAEKRLDPSQWDVFKPKVVQEQIRKPKPEVDQLELAMAEYASGARCFVCDELRDFRGQCKCVRELIVAANIATIDSFEARAGDPDIRRLRYVSGSASSAAKRVSLRSGHRHTPTDRDTLSEHATSMLVRRTRNGSPMEWQANNQPSGDELPL